MLNQAICVIDPPPSRECPTRRVAAITTNRAWVTARHELDVDLASYRAQVAGTKANQSALQAVLDRQPETDEDISMMAAIENGPQTLWRSAFHEAGPALVPGPLGWVVFGILLFGLLSWLLKVNASQLAGPVSVDDVKSGDSNDQLTAALRVAVLQNVAEPGAAPGSPSTNPVTTLLDIAGGPLSAANKIVQAVQAVAGQRYGYRVTIDVTTGNLAGSGLVSGKTGAIPSDPAETTVLVRVMSLTSGVTYTSHLCEAPDPLQAVRTAGLWAAGYILNRSSRIPHWAAWEAETAHALITAKSTAEHTIPDLQAALAAAPNSGILLVLLGHEFELEGQMLDAISCYARAVTAYPRYFVARYRLAAALALMRHARDWRLAGQMEDEDVMRRAVKAAVHALEVRDDNAITDMKKESPDKTAFADLASTLLRALDADTRWAYRLAGVLRRSERESIWPALTPFSQHPAARFPGLVRSARQALSEDETQRRKLYKKADKPGGWWQISYNAACAHATKIAAADSVPPPADTDGREAWKEKNDEQARCAMDFLEQTLVRMGVEQLSAEWVSRDADLAMLRDLPRFTRFLAQLRSGG
jgi:tetratricopeptide (TPR) repeat protein